MSVSFTSRALPVTAPWRAAARDSAAAGAGRWIAVAAGTNTAIRSTDDGATWGTIDLYWPFDWTDIDYDGTAWVVVSSDTLIRRSTDGGDTWSDADEGTGIWRGITHRGSLLVAIADAADPRVYRSSNHGASWSSGSHPTGGLSICDSGSAFVTVGGNTVTTSPDGTTWTSRSFGSTVDMRVVKAAGGAVVAVGAGKWARSADDGATWTTGNMPNTGATYTGLAYAAGEWIAVDPASNSSAVSADGGATWSAGPALPTAAPAGWRCLEAVGPTLLALANNDNLAGSAATTAPPVGVTTLPIVITVAPAGVASLPMTVSILPTAWVTGAGAVTQGSGGAVARWRPVVTLDGADVTARVMGEISTGGEEGGARLADFTLRPASGSIIAVATWSGKPVSIDIARPDGSLAMRLFTGVIDQVAIDQESRALVIRCTDALQDAVSALANAAIATLVGGRHSAAVFDATATGWRYARDRLSTRAASLDRSPYGELRVTPWAAKDVADITFTASRVGDASLTIDVADRAGLVNTVNITFGYRFPRLKADTYSLTYQYVNELSFAAYVNAGGQWLQRAQVVAALQAAGGSVVGDISYVPLPATPVDLGSGGYWNPGADDAQLCLGFTADVTFDYAKYTEETHRIAVVNEASVAAMGILTETLSGALEGVYPDPETAETKIALFRSGQIATPPPDKAEPVALMRTTADPTLTTESDRAACNAAIECLVDIAKTRIAASFRRNRVTFVVPLTPAVDFDKTVAVSCGGIVAKGKVCALAHRMDAAAATATTTVTIALTSAVGTGIAHSEDATAYSDASSSAAQALAGSPIAEFFGAATEDRTLTIDFPGVEDAERAKAAITLASTIRAPLAEDVFTYTAP